MQTILSHYAHLPGDRELVFQSLCALLAENPAGVDWSAFGPQEWALFAQMATAEGVAALAYHLLRTQPEAYALPSVDARAWQACAEQEALSAVRNALLFRQLEQVLRALSAAGIPVVLLKGADLAHSLYPAPGLRKMGDLDLLVPQARFTKALQLVHALGYHEYLPDAAPRLSQLLSNHAHLRKEGHGMPILELHRTLVAPDTFRHAAPMDWFWANLEPSRYWNDRIAAQKVFSLNPTANLLYLSAHLMLQHGGERASLHWLLDVQRLVARRGGEIDWAALLTQAGAFGWSGALRAALESAQECFPLALPDGLLAALQAQPGAHDALVDLKAEPAPTRTLGEWKKLSALGWGGRLRLLLALVFPAPAYMRWRYRPQPAWLWPLYYPYRWWDIARDGWRTLRRWLETPARHN